MAKYFGLLIVISLILGCSKEIESSPQLNYEFSIDSVLTQNGLQSLPKDSNGFYRLKINTTGSSQSHRVVGKILVNGKEPFPNERINFESNLFWWLRKGDTTATITKSYINFFTGEFTIVNLPPMIASKDELVPTINCCSLSGRGGQVNTVIAPIREMVGDTMIVKATHNPSKKIIFTKIILE